MTIRTPLAKRSGGGASVVDASKMKRAANALHLVEAARQPPSQKAQSSLQNQTGLCLRRVME